MSAEAPARNLKGKLRALPNAVGEYLHSIPDDDPLQIALRTYALSLALSLGPALVPFLTSPKARKDGMTRLGRILGRELRVTGFAFAMTAGVGGGCEVLEKNDSVYGKQVAEKRTRLLSMRLDAMVFWASSARIMWCFFYKPERLPRSYNKWIMTIANIDPRILAALRSLRAGTWSYRTHYSAHPELVSSLSKDLGYPAAWGDITRMPAYGGPNATATWKGLGVQGRDGIGGIPCELVHANASGGSCTKNVALRGSQAFASALAIYLPVHFLPILLTRPRYLLHPSKLLHTLLAVLRSASFLGAFVSSIWAAVCLTRTHLLARLLPAVSHDVWDGPFGGTFAGSLVCGGSIWLEQGRRRGEITLYVLPRAIRACLPERWVRSGAKGMRWAERLTFVLSLSTVLTAAVHRPHSLRGLSRWALAFIMKGPNAGFWKRRRRGESVPPTPIEKAPDANSPPNLKPYVL
ncbi:hypothetical protein FOMPIDRAFT_1040121 [Fomitopsis schrenkii]|uniref:Transmembrane protein 135 N-terminal domain-containing protein n=1 Tax=Fomitopsis schrenkii TaxID=2126942 RepID=S8ELY6_FOMSC|nr:hypothetical protein FOMPIDRAFT_1040121 [Fomitopsis schrenkii]